MYKACAIQKSVPYLKQIQERYEDNVIFTEEEGYHGVVAMRENTSQILRSHFNIQANDEESHKLAIIETAARLI